MEEAAEEAAEEEEEEEDEVAEVTWRLPKQSSPPGVFCSAGRTVDPAVAAITGRSVAAAAASKRGGPEAPAALKPHTTLSALQLRPSGSREAAEAAAVLLPPTVRHSPMAAMAASIPLAFSISAPNLPASLRLTTRCGKSMLLAPSASTVLLPALPAMANGAARLPLPSPRQPLPSPRLPLPPPPRNTPKTPAPYEATSDDAAGYDVPRSSLEGVEVRTDVCGGGTAAGGDSKSAAASPMMQALRRLGSVSDSLKRYSSCSRHGWCSHNASLCADESIVLKHYAIRDIQIEG